MELGPLLSDRTFQVSGGDDMSHSYVPSLSVDVPHGTEIQVWRTDHINQLLRLAHLAAKASNDLHDAVVALDFTFTDDEPESEPERPRPIECPQCGERERIQVNLVDTGVGSYTTHVVGSYRCLNPECPTNAGREIPQ